MYAVYRQTDPPTSVDHAIYCRFLSLSEKNLVICGSSYLRVYRLNRHVTARKTDGTFATGTKLECLLTANLFGNVVSMDSCYIPGSRSDCLLLAFEEAKVSLVCYDNETHDIKTASLHCFEDEFLKGGFTRDFQPPLVRSDPENRCAAMLIYGKHLAILPLTKDSLLEDLEAKPTVSTSALTTGIPGGHIKSYTVALKTLDERLQNVADMSFLYGYYEPTLLLLYEPNQTTTGRAAVRMDTYCIIAVSLNVKDSNHAVIWSVTQLPLDCFRVVPVPRPVGGVVVFAANSVIYLNQSVPHYGISVNANMHDATQFPLKNMEDKQITFDLSSADFIAPRSLVVSLKTGDIFVLTLMVDNMNAVKSMHLEKAASSVIPSAACKCDDGYVFLASRLGNSLLLKYWERGSYTLKVETSQSQKAKRPRLENSELQDDLEIYGEVVALKSEETMRVSQYSFDVCDSILNIGPCRSVTVGEPTTVPEEYLQKNVDPIVDFVSVAGHGKNGALSVLQRTVRPHLITSSAISNSRMLCTVGMAKQNEDPLNEGLIEGAQKYLLISKEVDTMVLEMRGEITELETSGFLMNTKTVAAGDMGNSRFILQVTPMCLVLLEDAECIQTVKLATSFPVCSAHILDPYAVLITDNGEVMVVQLISEEDGDEGTVYQLKVTQPCIQQNVPASAAHIYKDVSGLFSYWKHTDEMLDIPDLKLPSNNFEPDKRVAPAVQTVDISFGANVKSGLTADDEDELLYGDEPTILNKVKTELKQEPLLLNNHSGKRRFDSSPIRIAAEINDDLDEMGPHVNNPVEGTSAITFWIVICRENGLLEIFSLPDFKLVYMVRKFPFGYATLMDTNPLKLQFETDRPEEKMPVVREVLLVGLGANKARPFLFAVVDCELFVYEVFHYNGEGIADHLAIRFRRLEHSAMIRNQKFAAKVSSKSRNRQDPASLALPPGAKYFHHFENISGYAGVFIAGPYPYWVIVSTQGILRFHPMTMDQGVTSFASFHNINCYQGFIYLNDRQEMRICQLPAHISYDASCPVHKVSLKTTAHFVVYLLDSKTYAVALSNTKPSKTVVTLLGDEKQFETVEREEANFIYPELDTFSVQLYSPETWEPIPGASVDLEEFEHITVMKEVQLKSEGTLSGVQNYLALGTMYNYGEEVMVRGKVYICEVVEVVPEPGQPLTKNKIKILYNKEQKGPVTSLCSMSGYLLTGMAQKVYIWQFKDNDLQGISFLDMQMYIHQMVSIRNIALTADVYQSISLLRYQQNSKALSLASRDPRKVEVYAIEFMVDNQQLAFLVSDATGNLMIYQYLPEARESYGGQRLLRRADINIGTRVNSIIRIRCHVSDPAVDQKTVAYRRHLCWMGTLDGSIGFVLPVPEKTYRRLLMLQNFLVVSMPHVAGLNPKGFRSAKNAEVTLVNPQKNILDGNLLWVYLNLSLPEKLDLAKRIGTTREQILDDILEIERMSTHY